MLSFVLKSLDCFACDHSGSALMEGSREDIGVDEEGVLADEGVAIWNESILGDKFVEDEADDMKMMADENEIDMINEADNNKADDKQTANREHMMDDKSAELMNSKQ
ncbi:hypothetical protein NM688_g3707 [Phlebia brevispora]|uniref:Uncharacterized protein n=1 Tax=Phlebia brevispora TaxID=194682 RepID=A0ACC1T537_9APHY|nr:hypothetical protein NM688_g3707 [Phlebia brevispora]